MVFLLLIAGHETTVNLIGNGTLALIENPNEMRRLQSEPSLIKTAVEELLRYTSPVFTTTERYARDDAKIHSVAIPRGELTLGVIGSANRDEKGSTTQTYCRSHAIQTDTFDSDKVSIFVWVHHRRRWIRGLSSGYPEVTVRIMTDV
jgi:hypothetical protein